MMTSDEISIRELIDNWSNALCRKDLDRMMSYYSKDVIVFDVKPPQFIQGVEQWREQWELCLPHFPSLFEMKFQDLVVHVDGDIAFAHWLCRFIGMPNEHSSMRATVGYKRENHRWLIVHEHVSFPFDPLTSKVVFTFDESSSCK